MSRFDYGWRPYVPVGARRAQARREMEKLRKQGVDIQPVEIEGRTIARSFWGKGWCSHLESFGDYSNRLPRGRTYARNGSVCHLAIAKGAVAAIVSGSALYNITVTVADLPQAKWGTLKKQCVGRIGSLLELLQGRLSDEIMGVVTDRAKGLFPQPGEIRYECDCPDWAGMCKHIAAVMYGIGARLDSRPELLFLLRGVDHEELIAADAAAGAITGGGSPRRGRRSLAASDLEGVFGVELEDCAGDDAIEPVGSRRSKGKADKRKAAKGKVRKAKEPAVAKDAKRAAGKKSAPARGKSAARKPRPFKPSARSVFLLRKKLGMSRAEFAAAVGVSGQSIKNWEEALSALKLNTRSLAGLTRLYERVSEQSD